jgi:hypothetical protein
VQANQARNRPVVATTTGQVGAPWLLEGAQILEALGMGQGTA